MAMDLHYSNYNFLDKNIKGRGNLGSVGSCHWDQKIFSIAFFHHIQGRAFF